MAFVLTDGSAIERQVAECHTLCFKEKHMLSETVTLEILGLVFNLFTRTL